MGYAKTCVWKYAILWSLVTISMIQWETDGSPADSGVAVCKQTMINPYTKKYEERIISSIPPPESCSGSAGSRFSSKKQQGNSPPMGNGFSTYHLAKWFKMPPTGNGAKKYPPIKMRFGWWGDDGGWFVTLFYPPNHQTSWPKCPARFPPTNAVRF